MNKMIRPSEAADSRATGNRPFVHLKVHSAYSLLEGALTIPRLAKLAVGNGFPALGLTDTNNLFGALEFSDKLAGAGEFVGELQCPKQIVGVGQAERRKAVADRQLGKPRDGERALQQRVGRVHLEVHERPVAGGATVSGFGRANHLVHGRSATPFPAACNSMSSA